MRDFLLVVTLVAAASAQKDPHWVNGRNTIVHLFEWKFSDIAAECERFLAPKGYAGVQTSPVNENLIITSPFRPWYERYQPISYVLKGRSGDENAFADMVRRCNNVGVRIYVDVVFNHMCGSAGTDAVGTAGNHADTNNNYYPAVPYGPGDFHPSCEIKDYNNAAEVRNCELVGLHDLNQGSDYVRGKIIDFLNHLVAHGVAGFRVDIAKHMWPADLEYIFGHVNDLSTEFFPAGSRAFVYQEVSDLCKEIYFTADRKYCAAWADCIVSKPTLFDQRTYVVRPENGTDAIRSYEYTGIGVVTEFRFGRELSNCFHGNNDLKWLYNFGPDWALLDSESALAFIDNHDNQRDGDHILTYKEPKLYKMAIAFMLAWPYGVSRVMSSFAFTDIAAGPPSDSYGNILDVSINSDGICDNGWVCEHRWRQIFNMVAFKNTVTGTSVANWWDNGKQQIAFSRGNRGFIAFNDQYDTDLKQTLQTGLPAGVYCDLISGSKYGDTCSGKSVTVNGDGTAYIQILSSDDDGVLAISADSRL